LQSAKIKAVITTTDETKGSFEENSRCRVNASGHAMRHIYIAAEATHFSNKNKEVKEV
jgi:hypothetical protein